MLLSSFTVKVLVLVLQEFKLILPLTVCSKRIDEKRSEAASLYHRIISATMHGYCSNFFIYLFIFFFYRA